MVGIVPDLPSTGVLMWLRGAWGTLASAFSRQEEASRCERGVGGQRMTGVDAFSFKGELASAFSREDQDTAVSGYQRGEGGSTSRELFLLRSWLRHFRGKIKVLSRGGGANVLGWVAPYLARVSATQEKTEEMLPWER